jgi:phosphoglycolate phosphatase-like HAD superfamily hydrolase
MAGATSLGIRTVFAHYGYSWSKDKSPIERHPADYEIRDILELVDIVDGLNAEVAAGASAAGTTGAAG